MKYSINLYGNESDLLLLCQYLVMHDIEEWAQRRYVAGHISYYVFLSDEDVLYLTIALRQSKVRKIDDFDTEIFE